ncbi:MAG: hypothetical protein QOE11_2767 [Solirubrobacteraceae bacterium]|jgi:hypothetical protein|nr:hypothetical protein [Solirubrobacteraceae bacterium]
MEGDISAAQTRRRIGGAVLLLAGLIVAVLVLRGGGDKPAATVARHLPIRIVSVPPLGLGFAHPTSWRRKVTKRVIGLRSPDGSIVVFFASPLARPGVAAVKAEAEIELRRQFAPATIVNDSRQQLGNRSVASFELQGRDKGKTVHVLELVDSTQYRTYAVTVVTGAHPSRSRLREARQIVATVRFSKPVITPVKTP